LVSPANTSNPNQSGKAYLVLAPDQHDLAEDEIIAAAGAVKVEHTVSFTFWEHDLSLL
jgi:hypothetical protein